MLLSAVEAKGSKLQDRVVVRLHGQFRILFPKEITQFIGLGQTMPPSQRCPRGELSRVLYCSESGIRFLMFDNVDGLGRDGAVLRPCGWI